MGSTKDFQTINGKLVGYSGAGGDIVIPEGVTGTESAIFWGNFRRGSVALPESVKMTGIPSLYEHFSIPGKQLC